MKVEFSPEVLSKKFDKCRGRFEANVPLAKSTWFRVGGPAEYMFWPADLDDLTQMLKLKPQSIPVTIIGFGSNIMVRDGGIPGITVRLGKSIDDIIICGTEISVGGGLSNLKLSKIAYENGISGFEFLSGIPGTVGGSIHMNAGAYGSEIKNILLSVQALNGEGTLMELPAAELKFGYRTTEYKKDLVYVRARFKGISDDRNTIRLRMEDIYGQRQITQPVRRATGGSTFVNPPGFKAWELIDAAGCRGLVRGGATISAKHCNFLVNTGAASASDLEELGEEVRRRVYEHSGIILDWEIHRIGLESNDLCTV